MEPICKLETITPEIAKQLLAKSKGNRPINQKSIDQLVYEINRDNWLITGETIKISEEGYPLDGHHRLNAVVISNKTINTLVIRNLSKEVFKYIDTGRSRSAGDLLTIEGLQNGKEFASMALFILYWNMGQFGRASHGGSNSGKRSIITNAIISEFVHKYKSSLEESLPYGYVKTKKIITPTMVSSMHYICKKINFDDADYAGFLEKLYIFL